jgi:hypothetical protein
VLPREPNVEFEDVLEAGISSDIAGVAFLVSVTCLTNPAIARTQNFAGVEKGNNTGRICAASVDHVS